MKQNFRALLVIALLSLQAVAVMAIIVLTGAAMRPVLVKQMDRQMSTSAEIALGRSEGVLQTTDDSAELAQRAFQTGLIDVKNTRNVDGFLRDELFANDKITGAYVGLRDGTFIISQRGFTANADEYRTKIIDYPGGNRRTTIIAYDEKDNATSLPPESDNSYDPRTRDWYKNAEATDGTTTVWSDPYVFFTSKKPGLTASRAVRENPADPSSAVMGVVGVDIELTQLSIDLRDNVSVTDHGSSLIVGRTGNVIATRDPANVIRPNADGTFRPISLDELADATASEAYNAAKDTLATIPNNKQAITAFTIDGEPYRAVFAPIEDHRDWYVLVASSEADYLGEIQRAQRVNAVIAIAVGLAIVVLALPLLRYLASRGERLQQRANTDVLTGLANRRHFEEVLEKQIARARDRSRPLAVAMLDLDHFKAINDTYGHGAGDQALIDVARHLTSSVREEDLVARLGGDEFAILFDGEGLDHAHGILERARILIESSPVLAGDHQVTVRITAGVADLIPGVTGNAVLLRRADQALYVAKERGRNQVATIRDVDPAVAGVTVPSDRVAHGDGAPRHTPSAPSGS